MSGEGLVAGEWKISGVPAFEPTDGRFAGYRGVALREAPAPAAARRTPSPTCSPDPDSLRELVHEIKTPLNAIIGFAEIIEGQYLGPADRRYRERAADIVAQARLLLTAIDDLDFAAKVHSLAAGSASGGSIWRELVERAGDIAAASGGAARRRARCCPDDRPSASPRSSRSSPTGCSFGCAARVIERAEAGERLRICARAEQRAMPDRRSPARPRCEASPDAQLFEPPGGAEERIDRGFSLRLVRGLARIAGGDLVRRGRDSRLTFRARLTCACARRPPSIAIAAGEGL